MPWIWVESDSCCLISHQRHTTHRRTLEHIKRHAGNRQITVGLLSKSSSSSTSWSPRLKSADMSAEASAAFTNLQQAPEVPSLGIWTFHNDVKTFVADRLRVSHKTFDPWNGMCIKLSTSFCPVNRQAQGQTGRSQSCIQRRFAISIWLYLPGNWPL